ncbi:hypothetical protein ZWY2020_043168 [Hordeum vulgare]|nr:hypothetical protein ZWY2020_043168 [Hordeum vulgare]
MAIFVALRSPELEVVGLTTIFSNVYTALATALHQPSTPLPSPVLDSPFSRMENFSFPLRDQLVKKPTGSYSTGMVLVKDSSIRFCCMSLMRLEILPMCNYLEEMCTGMRIHNTEGIIQEVNIRIAVQCRGKLDPLLLAST